jgi:hypothetical protein
MPLNNFKCFLESSQAQARNGINKQPKPGKHARGEGNVQSVSTEDNFTRALDEIKTEVHLSV